MTIPWSDPIHKFVCNYDMVSTNSISGQDYDAKAVKSIVVKQMRSRMMNVQNSRFLGHFTKKTGGRWSL